MSISAHPLHPVFVASVRGLDLHKPVGDGEVAEVRRLMDQYGVCVFRNDPPLDDEQHAAFSRRFGPLMNRRTPVFKVADSAGPRRYRIPHPEVTDVSNLDPDGRIFPPDHRRYLFKKGDQLWHADVSFNRNRATYSLLNAVVIPPRGGDTGFVDLRAAYDALPAASRARLDPLVAVHSIWTSRTLAGFPPPTEEELGSVPDRVVEHPLVQVNPRTGRRALYVGSHAAHIKGWPETDGRTLIRELIAFASQPQFTYYHRWEPGDLVMWDNYCTMHRGTDFEDQKYVRDMRRTTVREWDDSLSEAEIDALVAQRERRRSATAPAPAH